MYYRWIDTEMPAWAVTKIRERSRRAWNSFYAEERREKAEAEKKAEQEKERVKRILCGATPFFSGNGKEKQGRGSSHGGAGTTAKGGS